MNQRPTGTVTFLFTDIEGSTQLWELHPQWMATAHQRQEAILRAAFAAHGGYPYKMIGDAFQVAFGSAPAAVAAAVAAQRALHAEPWGDPGEVRVRMALHTGETEERGDDYVGPILNRVARLMSAGHGGQVLLSQATCELVSDRLPTGVTLVDLGERRLRDLNRPEHVRQAVAAGLLRDFPPLKTLDALPNNLPIQLTRFVGREQSIAEIAGALTRSRLVTLTGAGGAGKTRLAVQVGSELADRFAHGVWLVELAPITDQRQVPQAVASAVGVPEVPGRPVLEAVTARLAGEERLIVVDNCEHLLDTSAELVATLLKASPRSRVLATSREPLRVAGESAYRVPSLGMPEPREGAPANELARSEAVRLFADRAANASSSFTLIDANTAIVAEICRRLDGIPLAIELAAARVSSLPIEKIAERLDDRFRLLSRGDRTALPRQQTLRALIDWSHDLLTEPERVLLRRLAVFAGGFTLEAAEAVCAGAGLGPADVLDLLTSLVDRSLVTLEAEGARYSLLETIRQYALERLRSAGEEGEVRDRHLDHYVTLAENAAERIHAGGLGALRELDAEHENLLAAHASCDGCADRAVRGLRLVVALEGWLFTQLHLEQGHRMTVQALSRPGAEERSVRRAQALFLLARLYWNLGRYPESEESTRAGSEIAGETGDLGCLATAARYMGCHLQVRGDRNGASRCFHEGIALARRLGDHAQLSHALTTLAELHREAGELDAAEPLYEESLQVGRDAGDWSRVAVASLNLAMSYVGRNALDRARAALDEALRISDQFGLRSSGQVAIDVCAGLAAARGEWRIAARLHGASEAGRRRSGGRPDPTDAFFLAPWILRTRVALGDEAFSRITASGSELGSGDALAEARSWLGAIRGRETGADALA